MYQYELIPVSVCVWEGVTVRDPWPVSGSCLGLFTVFRQFGHHNLPSFNFENARILCCRHQKGPLLLISSLSSIQARRQEELSKAWRSPLLRLRLGHHHPSIPHADNAIRTLVGVVVNSSPEDLLRSLQDVAVITNYTRVHITQGYFKNTPTFHPQVDERSCICVPLPHSPLKSTFQRPLVNMSTASSFSQHRFDAWKLWSRKVRRNRRTYAINSLISESYVDPDMYKFMQIEIRFHGDNDIVVKESMSGEIVNNEGGGERNKNYLDVYVPTTRGKRPHHDTMRTPTTNCAITAVEAQTKHLSTTTATETKEQDKGDDNEDFLHVQESTGLLRVSTSMVLDVQHCLFSQIQLERQEHHLPPLPMRHHRKHGVMLPPLPPAETSNASSLSNNSGSNNTTPATSTTSSSKEHQLSAMMATCLICPAAVQVPPSKHALVYCTNCTTLATASLLRKQARSTMAAVASPCVSVSDLSSSVL